MAHFHFTYDLNVSLEQRLGVELAAAIWSEFLLDDVTVNLHIVATDSLNDGQAVGGAVPLFHEQNYGVYQEYVKQDATSEQDDLVIASQQDGNTVDVLIGNEVVDGNSTILLTSAQAKALGMEESIQLGNGTVWDRDLVDPTALDGYILISNSYNWSYDFTRQDEVPEEHLDFLTMALHEIGHALGFVSGLDGLLEVVELYSGETQSEGFTPLDLLRYTDASQALTNPDGQVADLTVGAEATFSLDGETSLATFSTGQDKAIGGDGYQASHWERFRDALGIMDPTLGYQERTDISHLDLQAFDGLGWDINYGVLDQGLDLDALYEQAMQAVAADFGIGAQEVNIVMEAGQDWHMLMYGRWWQALEDQMIELGYGRWWQEFEQQMLDLGYGRWWQEIDAQLLELGYGRWWQAFEEQVLDLGYGRWWQDFEGHMSELGYGRWWQAFEPQMMELSYGRWWQEFEQQMLDLGYGSWWQDFEADLLELGYGRWWQAFEEDVLELGYGRWWQILEEKVIELGYGRWWQDFESNMSELGYGRWWQAFELGYGRWWQELDPFLATLDSVDGNLTEENTQVADGGVGGRETEIFYGGADDDIIAGDEKQDRINAGDGDDLLDGKAGHDVLWGEGGRDLIYGQRGNDLIYGGDDDDLLLGEEDEDELHGEAGDDILDGGHGRDILSGGDGRDDLKGGTGRDVLSGDAGNDRLDGETGNDIVIGGEGRDQVDGGSGHDLLYGDTYLGEETLKQLRALLKQQPIDTSSPETIVAPDTNALNPIRVEAEAMTLLGDYTFRTDWANDSGDTLKVLSTATGTTTFTGPSGNYMVVVRYHDEDDAGNATLDFSLNGSPLNSFILDQDTGQYYTRTVVQNLALMPGDVLSVVATADGPDNVNLDYLEFVPLDNLIVTQLDPTNSASVTETTTAATEGNILRVEAESMLLVGDYSPSDYSFSSGGQLIGLSDQGQGKAITTFTGETGFYDVVVGYHDEQGDGIAHLSAFLDGIELDSWLLDQDLDSKSPTANNLINRTVASGVALSSGDIFELAGLRGEGNKDELAHIDYVEFITVEAPTLGQGMEAVVLNSTVVDQNLVSHWSFDETEGTVATDQTGTHHATLTNTPTDGSQWSVGAVEGALYLDGVNDYVAVANSNAINLGTHEQRTISLWFQVDDAAIADRKQVIYEEGGTVRGLNIYIHDGKLYVGGWNNNSNQSGWAGTFFQTDDIVSDEWHHVALVLDGDSEVRNGALTGYLDGDIFGVGAGSQLWQHGDPIAFGAVSNTTRFHDRTVRGTGNHGFAGRIDDAYLYNQALDADEIGDLFGRDNDQIQGGSGQDIAFGGKGNDVIYGESQTDISSFTLNGTQSYNGHTYLLSQVGTWEEAQSEARRLGGNLVTINNAAEEDWLQQTFGTNNLMWIGLTDQIVEGEWEWISGEALNYTNWATNEPNNGGTGEDYAVMNRLSANQWDDRGLSNHLYQGIIELNSTNHDTLFGDRGNDTIYGNAGDDALYGDDLNTALSEGLVVHWNFDEGGGSSTGDESGHTNTGSLWGNSSWTDGRIGGAVDLSGFDAGVSALDAPELDIEHQITLASWINADSFDRWDGIITKGTHSTSYALHIDRNESSEHYLSFTANWGSLSGGIGGGTWDSHTQLNLNQWQHVAATYDGEAIRFYIDGQLDSNVVYVDLEFGTNNEDLVIGADLPGGDEYFDGAMDDVRVYNRALSAVEVSTLATVDNHQTEAIPHEIMPQFMHLFDDGNDNLALYEEALSSNGTFNNSLVNADSGFNNSTVGIATVDGKLFYQLLDYGYIGRRSNTLYEVTMEEKGVFNWTLRSDESNLSNTLGFATADGQTFYQLADDGVGTAALYEAELQADGTFNRTLLNADSNISRFGSLTLSTVDGKTFYYLHDDGVGTASSWQGTLQSDGTFVNTLLNDDSNLGRSTLGQVAWDPNPQLNESNDDQLIGGVGNDALIGGAGNDTLNGTDSIAVGFFEKDTLRGGAGADTFILGDASQAYYQGMGDRDYALITDFNSAEDRLQLHSAASHYSQQQQGSDLHLYDDTGLELVAILEKTTTLNLTTVGLFV